MQQKKEFTLRKCLEMLTMDEMHEIRKSLKIKNASKLRREQMIEKLEKGIPESIANVFLLFDQHRYDIVKAFIKSKGVIPLEVIGDDLDFDDLYFLNKGIIYKGYNNNRFAYVMPKEITDIFKRMDNREYGNIIKRNTDWVMYLHGMIYYYGVIDSLQAYYYMKKDFENIDLDPGSYSFVTIDGTFYYQIIECYVKGHKMYYYNGLYEDATIILDEHNKRKAIDFFPYSKEQLIRAGHPYYYEQTPETKRLKDFLRNHYNLDEEMIDALVGDCTEVIRLSCGGNNLSNILDFFNQTIGIDSLETAQKLGDIIVEINNNYPMCALKGHPPRLLRQETSSDESKHQKKQKEKTNNIYSFQTGKKIGRNDPCPCGSGLKFKQCCGKN